MCKSCGCAVEPHTPAIVGALLRQNDSEAEHNRAHFDAAGTNHGGRGLWIGLRAS